jgi:hypothetical protein
MNAREIREELEALRRKTEPLQRREWKLIEQLNKVRAEEILSSGVLGMVRWRLRTFQLNLYLECEFSNVELKRYVGLWGIILEKDIPYPHSHLELKNGVTLNQDDGTITISFDSVYKLRKFIKEQKLPIMEWRNLETLLQKIKPCRSLLKYLESKYYRR